MSQVIPKIFLKIRNEKFHKNPLDCRHVIPCGQRRTDLTRLIFALFNCFASASDKGLWGIGYTRKPGIELAQGSLNGWLL